MPQDAIRRSIAIQLPSYGENVGSIVREARRSE
jgi:hypothetical protein